MVKPAKRRTVELESIIQSDFINEVRERGGRAYKLRCDGRRGFPDVVVIYKGEILFVELKTTRGKVSKGQAFVQNEMTRAGAKVITVWGREPAWALLYEIFTERDV